MPSFSALHEVVAFVAVIELVLVLPACVELVTLVELLEFTELITLAELFESIELVAPANKVSADSTHRPNASAVTSCLMTNAPWSPKRVRYLR